MADQLETLSDDGKIAVCVTTKALSSCRRHSSDSSVSKTSNLLSTVTVNLNNDSGIHPSYGAITGIEANCDAPKSKHKVYSNGYIARVVTSLLLGVFTSNADGTLVIASHAVIGSEFDRLSDSSWLLISFLLAAAATQSMYGNVSDIYGRKSVLLVSYGLFALGCLLIGVARSMNDVILGRVLSGSGGAGMMALASIIITDLAPLRDVATWQSYLNVIATIGRSLGGPIGGWLTDSIGWRWPFLGQVPLFLAAMGLTWIIPSADNTQEDQADKTLEAENKLARVDLLGATFLSTGILAFLLPIEIGGNKIPWSHPTIFALFAGAILLLGLFCVTEARWAREPIFPLRLLRNRNLVLIYVMILFQSAAQFDMFYTIPLYFQVTQRSSNTSAGAHLLPSVLGNTVGGIVVGLWIKRYGRYKGLVIVAASLCCACYLLLIMRWEGHTSWFESLYIIPGGMGMGMMQSVLFIALQASINSADKAVATSAYFLGNPFGNILGIAAASALIVAALHNNLQSRLMELGINKEDIQNIISQAVASVDYLDQVPTSEVGEAVVSAYIDGLRNSHLVSLALSSTVLIGGLLLKEHKLIN